MNPEQEREFIIDAVTKAKVRTVHPDAANTIDIGRAVLAAYRTTTPTAAHTLSPAELDELEALEQSATSGPWAWIDNMAGDTTKMAEIRARHNALVCDFGNGDNHEPCEGTEPDEADWKLIIALRNNAAGLIAQARAALTGQATAPAQAAPSEQDERAKCRACELSVGDLCEHHQAEEDHKKWQARAAQGASGAPTEPAPVFWLGPTDVEWLTRCPGSNASVTLLRKGGGQRVPFYAAPSGPSGAQGEPTGVTGAAGGEDWTEANKREQEYFDRWPHDARATASQAAPGVGTKSHLVEDVIAAAQAVVQDAIDGHRSEVHPCDRNDDDLAVRACSSEIRVLHAALKAFSTLPAPAQPAEATVIDYGTTVDKSAPHAPVVRADVPDSRPIHAAADDEPQVDERARYFWRTGWNAYRNAMLAASPSPSAPQGQKTGREMYEAWAALNLLPKRWDDLSESTQVHWNKKAIYDAAMSGHDSAAVQSCDKGGPCKPETQCSDCPYAVSWDHEADEGQDSANGGERSGNAN